MKYDFTTVIDRVGHNARKWNVGEGYISMTIADMDLPVAPEIVSALKNRLEHQVYGYDFLDEEYYNSVINWYKKIHSVELKREWLLYSTGVRPSINAVIEALTQKNDTIALLSPVYAYFYTNIEESERKYVECELDYDEEYHINFEKLEEVLAKDEVKMLILCNPHNPLGRVWEREEVERVANLALKHNTLLISDEIHCDLTFKEKTHTMSLTISEEVANNTITFIAPTKTFNIAGLRTSNVIVPNKEHREKIEKILIKNKTNTNNFLSGVATTTAYNEGEEWYNEVLEVLADNRDFLKEFINTRIPEIKLTPTNATYLEWLDYSSLTTDSDEFCNFLKDNVKLQLSSGSHFGKGGEGKARLNFACTKEVLEDALNRLEKGVALYKNR